MMLKFECAHCRQVFEAAGAKEEWVNPTYGPCWEYTAPCPSCQAPSKEHRPRKRSRGGPGGPEMDSCGEGDCGRGVSDCCGGGFCE